ncbi:MAG TPA: HAMP domain-containing sensor histidine kinase, partial [Jatrophihabitantaceae bacterium]
YRGGYSSCSDSYWHDLGNNCGASFSVGLAWFELVLVGLIVLGIGWLLARWALYPVRAMAGTVAKLGPTSLDVRLRATGPSDETRQLSDAIDHLLDRVAVGYEAQRRFAANASHELRTPLATQRALIEVSLSSALTPEQLELLSRQLLATNERNERLVDGLLTLAETDGGLMTNAPLRLDQIVAETVESLRNAAQEAEIEIETVLDAVTVIGERPLLERLTNNLLINAIKYNCPGGTVTATVTRDGAFTVVNTGPVVAPEQMAGLFEPFRRGSGERLDHGGGVGLGLTIARSIVTAHGAAIHARANPGGGLTITVRLSPA